MTSKKLHELLTMLVIAIWVLLFWGVLAEHKKQVDGLESLVEFYREDNLRLETELHELKRIGEK